MLPKEEWQGALCLSAAPAPAPAPAPATHPWADGRCRRREEAGVGPTCQLPPARRRAPAHVATCSPQLLALDSLLPHPVFVFCYRVVPGHRNWQIETAAWICPSFFHCALEIRWLGVRKSCGIGLFYKNCRSLLQETGWLVSDFISVCLETRCVLRNTLAGSKKVGSMSRNTTVIHYVSRASRDRALCGSSHDTRDAVTAGAAMYVATHLGAPTSHNASMRILMCQPCIETARRPGKKDMAQSPARLASKPLTCTQATGNTPSPAGGSSKTSMHARPVCTLPFRIFF